PSFIPFHHIITPKTIADITTIASLILIYKPNSIQPNFFFRKINKFKNFPSVDFYSKLSFLFIKTLFVEFRVVSELIMLLL
ncbi:MAG: hypothetical protein ACO2PO_22230, partial [Candidatus Calescibacterium sp.]